MKNLQFNPYQCGAGRGGSKKSKPISALSSGVRLKSYPISTPPPLWGGENTHGAKWGGAGQNCHPLLSISSLKKAELRSPFLSLHSCGCV